jgi:ubiquinone/menaquinone biosynthesis C-methylase UbiE
MSIIVRNVQELQYRLGCAAMIAFLRHGPRPAEIAAPRGNILLHAPRHYDFQVWLATGGKERWLRETILGRARLVSGETMLDIGCGTGTLALAAKRRLGLQGKVFGVDAALEMVAAAQAKARKAGCDIQVETAAAQALPFADGGFDLVTSTLMLHHIPKPARPAAVAEMLRVLRPGGRALVVDFATSSEVGGGLFHRLHRYGRVRPEQIAALLTDAGFEPADSGPLGMRDLHYVLAVKPDGSR